MAATPSAAGCPPLAIAARVAATACVHQSAGSCSAHPGCGAEIVISVAGATPAPRATPVSASTSAALTNELPMSRPRSRRRAVVDMAHILHADSTG